MTNGLQWVKTAVAALVAVSLLGAPQVAAAKNNCERQDKRFRNDRRNVYSAPSYSEYRGSGSSDVGYRNNRNPNRVHRDDGYYTDNYGGYRSTRSAGASAAIVGGSAAAGAVVGGLVKGGKGAAIGAAVGGIGGLIYDRKTRDRR